MNKLNQLFYDLYTGLALAENQGDVRDYLPRLQDLEREIAKLKDAPELLDGFDPEGIATGYAADGYIWCECMGDWCHRDDQQCCGLNEEGAAEADDALPSAIRLAQQGARGLHEVTGAREGEVAAEAKGEVWSPPVFAERLLEPLGIDTSADVDWGPLVRMTPTLAEQRLVVGALVHTGEWLLLAWRWIVTLDLAWGEMPRPLAFRLPRPLAFRLPQPSLARFDLGRPFWAEFPGSVGVLDGGVVRWLRTPRPHAPDPLLWAECARIAEIDAREQGGPELAALAQEIGEKIAALYAGAEALARDDEGVPAEFIQHFNEWGRVRWGFHHEHHRHALHGGWTTRISDLGNDAGWAVSIIDWHRHEIGTWHLLARLLAARALRLAREWYHDQREVFERLELDEFDVAPALLAVGLEDSLRRLLLAPLRAEGRHLITFVP